MTGDRERYLILLNGLVLARHELIIGEPLKARQYLHEAVEMVKENTSQGQFQRDCAAAQEAVEAHGG